ncbi:hypothetical protein CQW23_25106 [Capsicum baccatum]|uniref:NB-ARC domain-containing protein n=1 Tax=Capsicum baccatum TaxID=33114 RepID=A0A2G2VK06_CAPBA|nr:hypothetical protein CQW23_25106 [Capsicum baccatum]
MLIEFRRHGSDRKELARISSSSTRYATGTNTIVGMEDDFKTIVDHLTAQTDELTVTPVVGIGRIGKSTLSRKFYHDQFIQHRFDTCAWVTVSENYNERQVLLDVVSSIRRINRTDESIKIINSDQLAEIAYRSLNGRRFLIVIDDLWSNEAWDQMQRLFPDDKKKSRILLTTRLKYVADYVNCPEFPPHNMSFLTSDDSWSLFTERLFRKDPCPPQLEPIGKYIIQQFQGLPFSITVIAGLLGKVEPTRDNWKKVEENLNSFVGTVSEQCQTILSLSYRYLPQHLKACFLYIGGFPDDMEISVSKLIRLWIAELFVKPRSNKRLEVVAEEYLQDLIDRSQFWPGLETLDIRAAVSHGQRVLHRNIFLPNLKQLRLRFTSLAWEDMVVLANLPNLEVLKAHCGFIGTDWRLNENVVFQRLKYIRLEWEDLERWEAASDNFLMLEQLVLSMLFRLEEIPQSIGEIMTLKLIQIEYCGSTVKTSAKKIQQEQESWENDELQVRIIRFATSGKRNLLMLIEFTKPGSIPAELQRISSSSRRYAIEQNTVVGMEDDFNTLVKRLTSQTDDLTVIPIVEKIHVPPQLEETGKHIIQQCQGLPLPIIVIAGLLVNVERTHDNWKKVKENLNSFFGTVSEQCQAILSLSYSYLPQHLKACFPEDMEISVSKLIRLWIAELFINSRSKKRLEVVAEEHLQDLIDRSLILAESINDQRRVVLPLVYAVEAFDYLPEYGVMNPTSEPTLDNEVNGLVVQTEEIGPEKQPRRSNRQKHVNRLLKDCIWQPG